MRATQAERAAHERWVATFNKDAARRKQVHEEYPDGVPDGRLFDPERDLTPAARPSAKAAARTRPDTCEGFGLCRRTPIAERLIRGTAEDHIELHLWLCNVCFERFGRGRDG